MPCVLEIPIDTLASADAAFAGGAHRIELCSALAVGGLTPSIGLLKSIIELKNRKYPSVCTSIFVMIRPRAGDFHYSDSEIDLMVEDISSFSIPGVGGFVFGALLSNSSVDFNACKRLLLACKTFPATFHRAFDYYLATSIVPHGDCKVNAALSVVDELCRNGFSRVLTSGGQISAFDGRVLIKALIQHVEDMRLPLVIMPGSGINVENVEEIVNFTGCTEVHSSCKGSVSCTNAGYSELQSKMLASFGSCIETNKDIVKSICEIISR